MFGPWMVPMAIIDFHDLMIPNLLTLIEHYIHKNANFFYLFEEIKTAPTLAPFPNHSVGTPTLHPFASLIHRPNTGFAFGISISPSLPSSVVVVTPPEMVVFLVIWEEDVGVPPAVLGVGSKGEILPRRLGACFLRSRFIVSI